MSTVRTAKPAVADGAGSASRRAQPVRQTRINPQRTSSLNRANAFASAPARDQPIDIFPGVTHFADAITALPKELVRHFTLLKEVDAKIFTPEAALFQLLHEALNAPAPEPARLLNDASSSAASVSAPIPAPGSNAGTSAPSNDGSAVFDPANIPRRTLFRDTALKIQEMLVSLEEKNHVLATANDALQKQLGRIEEIWPHLENEFSDEAKWGSTTHWAYVENRQAKANDKQAERSRREGAATLSAAAQQLAEEAAARSSDRKQALAVKKTPRTQVAEADGDKAQDTGRKPQGGGKRKPLPDGTPVGLGITTGPPGNGSAPSKRRKVEAVKPNGGTPAERAMSSVFGNSSSKQKTTSPRSTPAPEGGAKKRKALPTSSNQAKKRTNAATSLSVTSSPVIGTFPDPVRGGQGSPVPPAPPLRPASSRARQNSTQSNIENARQRPPSAASSKVNGNQPGTPDPSQQSNGAKQTADPKAQKETTVPVSSKPQPVKSEIEDPPVPTLELQQNGGSNKKENAAAKTTEEREAPKKEPAALTIQSTPASAVKTTKSGRASKPSTPASATFAEAASSLPATTTTTTTSSRSRPSRSNADTASTSSISTAAASTATTTVNTVAAAAKRSHKKGASISSAAAAAAAAGTHANAHQSVTTVGSMNSPTTTTSNSHNSISSTVDKDRDRDKEKEKEREKPPVLGAAPSNTSAIASTITSGHSNGGSSSINSSSGHNSNNNINTNNTNHGNKKQRKDAWRVKGGEDRDDRVVDDDDEEDDEQEPDPNEPVYCYCNQVSYGEMVACDGEGCPREWFHLECVGLKVAPKLNAKWYCEDCKKRLKGADRERDRDRESSRR